MIRGKDKLAYYVKYVVYICCFTSFCLIDQIVGSATGYIQYGYKYYTAFIMAVIVLTAYDVKSFFKIPYFIWSIIFFLGRELVLSWGESRANNYLELHTYLWCIWIYGIVFMRLFFQWFVEKLKPQLNIMPAMLGGVMLLLMALIRNDWDWTKVLLISLICVYSTNFKEKDLNNLYLGIADGIILGIFIVQIQAWMHRPYDTLRYQGMYAHANMNALLYVCAYCAILGKWYWLKLQRKSRMARYMYIMLAGMVLSTMFFTGARTATVTAVAVTMVFLLFQFLTCKRWKLVEVMLDLVLLAVSIVICFLPAYGLLRYMPAYIDEPLYFEGEVTEEKVNKGESITSEKYYDIEEALDGNVTRYLWFMNKEEAEEVEQELIEWFKELLAPMQVQARELVNGTYWYETDEVYVEPGTDKKHPIILGEKSTPLTLRIEIHKYFFRHLRLVGNKDGVSGVWLDGGYYATHCHNIFLQMAYDFGIIVGVMFIIVTIMLFNRIIFGLFENKSPMWYYRLFITAGFATIEVVFGMTEMAYIYGQLPLTMFWLVQYVVYHKQPHEIEQEQNLLSDNVEVQQGEKDLVILDLDIIE